MTTKQDAMEAAWDAANDAASDYEHFASRGMIEAAVQAYLAAREAEGWVMVPLSPTPQMLANGSGVFTSIQMPWDTAASVCYAHMLAARPGDR